MVPSSQTNLLPQMAIQSLQSVIQFLDTLPKNEETFDTIFQKNSQGLYETLDLNKFIPNKNHEGIFLHFENKIVGGGSSFVNHGNGTFSIILNISYSKNLGNWNIDFIVNVADWFHKKKRGYVDQFLKCLRAKYFISKKLNQPSGTSKKHPATEEELIEFYNDPENIEEAIRNAKQQIEEKINSSRDKAATEKQLNLSSAQKFINFVFNRYFDEGFKKYLKAKNRISLFEQLYQLYLEIKEQIDMAKPKNITAEQLKKMIQKEIKTLLENTSTPKQWKIVNKIEKPQNFVPQEPKKVEPSIKLVDLFDAEPKDKLVKPIQHLPKAEKDTNTTQLNESAEKDNDSNFFLEDYSGDTSMRF